MSKADFRAPLQWKRFGEHRAESGRATADAWHSIAGSGAGGVQMRTNQKEGDGGLENAASQGAAQPGCRASTRWRSAAAGATCKGVADAKEA